MDTSPVHRFGPTKKGNVTCLSQAGRLSSQVPGFWHVSGNGMVGTDGAPANKAAQSIGGVLF